MSKITRVYSQHFLNRSSLDKANKQSLFFADLDDPLDDLLGDLLPDETKPESKTSLQRAKPEQSVHSPAASPASKSKTSEPGNFQNFS